MKLMISTRSLVVEVPVRHVGLPGLVGQGGLEAHPARARALLGLGGDEAAAPQHPVDRGQRRHGGPALAQVPGDGAGPGVEAVSARRLRQATISSSSTAEVRLAGTLGPRLLRRPGPPRHRLGRGRHGDAPRTWSARWPPPPPAPSVPRRARRRRSTWPDPWDRLRTGVPELLTHRVPETMEPQTFTSTFTSTKDPGQRAKVGSPKNQRALRDLRRDRRDEAISSGPKAQVTELKLRARTGSSP